MLEVIDQYDADYIVLAKYMRVLTPSFVEKYHHKIINIHHSFYQRLLVRSLTNKPMTVG